MLKKILGHIAFCAIVFGAMSPFLFGHGATGVVPTPGAVVDVGGATTYTALTDTPGSYIADAIPYSNTAGTSMLFNGGFVFKAPNLGLNTTTPSNMFTCNGDAEVKNGSGLIIGNATQITADAAMELQILGTSGADSGAIFARFSNDLFQPHIDFVKSRSGIIGNQSIVLDNDALGGMHFHPDDGVDYLTSSARFGAQVDDPTPAVNDIGTEFVWASMPGGGGALRTVMNLKASGWVGIGELSPSAKFHMSDAGDCELYIEADTGNTDENNNPELHLVQDGNAVHGRVAIAGGAGVKFINAVANYTYIEGTSAGGDVGVQIAVSGTPGGNDGIMAATFDEDGQTGLGVSVPLFQLHIDGTMGMEERADAWFNQVGRGQFWIKDDAPCSPMFTPDDDVNHQLATVDGVETFTNKRTRPRVTTIASSGTPTPNADTDDMFVISALAVSATFSTPSGTPYEGQSLIVRIEDNGTARNLFFGPSYRSGDNYLLPSTTVINEKMYLHFMWEPTDGFWDLLHRNEGFSSP
jgi:hypothetical protein